MTVGLPGTGIGSIFYMLLAVFMPVKELGRTMKRQTNLKRWFLVILQVLFVIVIITALWSEVWLLNKSLAWLWGTLEVNGPLLGAEPSLKQTKVMEFTSASASFISLAFVITGVHILRFFVRRSRPTFGRTGHVERPTKPKGYRHIAISERHRHVGAGILTPARG